MAFRASSASAAWFASGIARPSCQRGCYAELRARTRSGSQSWIGRVLHRVSAKRVVHVFFCIRGATRANPMHAGLLRPALYRRDHTIFSPIFPAKTRYAENEPGCFRLATNSDTWSLPWMGQTRDVFGCG